MNMRFQLYSLTCLLVAFMGTVTAQNACFDVSDDVAGFQLSVETHATDVVGGKTTYRVYMSTPGTTDFVSACIGDGVNPLYLNTTTSFYQDPLGGTTAASINPLYYGPFPDAAYDSWVTIGIDQQPILADGETDISVLVDPNVTSWEVGFGAGGGVDISSPIGGGWYILPSSTNGISGDDQRVLLAQLTTNGEISGQLYIQVFPNGEQAQLIESNFSFSQVSCGVSGCTDNTACNYNDTATSDDGSCQFAAANFDCNGDCLTTETVFNVDMSCSETTYSSVHVTGPWCNWCGAESYNTLTDEDGDGTYSVSVCIPEGDVEYKYMVDNWADQENLVDDAQAGSACAAVTDASTYANRLTTAGTATSDTYGSCLTCAEQAEATQGCTDDDAVNYSATATTDNGSCMYNVTLQVDMEQAGLQAGDIVYVNGTFNEWCGDCNPLSDEDADGVWTVTLPLAPGTAEYKFTINGWSAQEELVAGSACDFNPEDGFANRGFTVVDAPVVMPLVCYNSCTECVDDIAGCMDSSASNYNALANIDNGLCQFPVTFRVDMGNFQGSFGTVNVNGSFNNWCGDCNAMTAVGDDVYEVTLNILADTIEYKFTLDGWSQQEEFTPGASCTATLGGFTNRSLIVDGAQDLSAVCWNTCAACLDFPGCMDQAAVNYDATALIDDASCQYSITFQVDMNQYGLAPSDVVFLNGTYNSWCGDCNPMDDSDGDGIWAFTVTLTEGLQEYKFTVNGWSAQEMFDGSEACTTDPAEYVNRVLDVAASTTLDAVCWNSCAACPVLGCTDATACNYVPGADQEDGSCNYCCADLGSNFEGYGLEQEIVSFDGIAGMTTYRFYITTPNATDVVSAVSGDAEVPTYINTTTSFYQDELGSVFPNGVNPLLFDTYPGLEFDSWVTIGISQSPDLSASEAAISMAEAESWTTEFENGQNLAIDGFFGGAWYVTSDNSNGIAGDDNKVLLAQLTTDGDLSGQFLVQVFPNGESDGLGDLVTLTFGPNVDTDAPAFVDFPADVTVSCSDALPPAEVLATDQCSDATVTMTEATSGDGCLSSVVRTYTATDLAGNSTINVWTITVSDDDAPVFSAPADIAVFCGDDLSPANTGDVTSAEDCNSYTVSYNDVGMFNMSPCVGDQIARTWRVLDDCGNEAVDIQVITVEDNAAPTFVEVPADTTIACGAAVPASSAVAADDCGSVTVSQSEVSEDGECAGASAIYRTFVAEDPCGNTTTHVQTIAVVDTVAPEFTSVPADVTVSVYDDVEVVMAEASDNCSAATVLYADEVDGSANDFALITRTFTAVDACGNAATATQTITVLEVLGCMDASACNYSDVATADDGSCDYCSCDGVYPVDGPYNLDIDTIQDGIDGMTTYQVYITVESADDFFSAVTGDVLNPTYVRTSTSFYQDVLGSASAHGINQAVIDAFPSVQYDSWVSVGLTSSADLSAGEGEVSVVEGEPWIAAFESGENIELTGQYGGGWYALNGSSNGIAGDDLRVLVGQFTTDGVFSGQMYVQVFPNGDGSNMQFQTLRWGEPQCGCQLEDACNYNPDAAYTDNDNCLYPADLYGAPHFDCDGVCLNDVDGDDVCDEDEVPGCTDTSACNYSELATDDNGSCTYPAYGYECDGTCISDEDNDGICDLNEVLGCNLSTACNFDPAATENDNSCTFDCYGCTDDQAANYDSEALLDDGGCLFGGCTDEGASNYDATVDFNDGSCLFEGCTNPQACNFTPGANLDDGSCDVTSCAGCTNDLACNYDSTATLHDGSCEFFSCRGCTQSGAFNYDDTASIDDGSCLFGGCTDETASNYDSTADFGDGSCEYPGCIDASACNYDLDANVSDGSCEFESCAGCMITFACNYDPTATIQLDSACDFYACCGDPTADNYEDGVADFLTYGCSYGGSAPMVESTGCELTFACNFGDTENPCEFSSCAGCTEESACNYDATATIPVTCLSAEDIYGVDYVDCAGECLNDVNENDLCDEVEVTGCTNPLACNFDDQASFDDGSCDTVSCAGCTDTAACNYDAAASQNDGSCDYVSCFGCTDAAACNYDASATSSDGSCTYPPAANLDCNGDCINDGNSNGICDEEETLGCTDLNACNFDTDATFDDSSCEYVSCTGCTNSSACNYDSEASINDGSCEFTSCLGCTDAAACNYDAAASADDGSCAFPEPEYDCEGNCLVDSDGDGICDAFDGNFSGCMDPLACNYAPLADEDDGSCDFCSCSGFTTDLSGYGVEIEEYATNAIAGYTTYRVYITTPNATDKVSAVTGQSANPTYIETTGDFYQHPNGGVFPNGINPILYSFVPEIEFDSWFTIGIDAAPVSANGEGNIQGLPEPEAWSSVFEGGSGFTIDDIIGSGWFVNPDVSNGVAGDDNKVLLAQLTTNGDLSGQFYVQVFPEGDNLNQERVTLTFGGSQCGCTDVTACNYVASAIIDDGSCYFPQFGYGCDDACLFDSEAPEFTEVPEDMNVSCSADISVVMPAATDNCDQDLTFTYNDSIVDGPCGETFDIIRSYIATDDFGHADTVTHVIHVVDEQAPVFTNVPAGATVECGDPIPSTQPVAVDNCNGVTITYTDEMTSTGCGNTGTLLRTWSAEDACGNVSTETTEYTIVDTTDPVISGVPADLTIGCEEEYDFPSPSASDACGSVELNEEVSVVEGGCANSYTLIRTFTAIDACGNFTQEVQSISVLDDDAPVFAGLPADQTLECGEEVPTVTVTAEDACAGTIEVSYSDAEVTLDACQYQVVRTFSATDSCGNTATHDWTLTFEDTTAPTFTVPADVTLDCSVDPVPANAGALTDAADGCDAAPAVNFSDVVTDGTFSLEGMTADFRVELRLNNLAAFPRVLEATGVPIGAGMELSLTDETSNPLNLRGAIEIDVTGNQVALTVADVAGSESYDYIEVRLSNISGAGIVGANIDMGTLLADAASADWTVTTLANEIVLVLDEVDGSTMEISEDGAAGLEALNPLNCLTNNIITRTWTVTDACGNSTTEVQTITLEDMTAPVFDFTPADQTLDCAAEYTLEMATATDACTGALVTYTDTETFPCDGSRVIERTFTAVDGCGNSTSAVQTISFLDTTAPTFTATPEDLSLDCSEALPVTIAEASDDCGTVSVNYTDETVAGDCAGQYTVLRTFTAEDGCGNSSTHVQTIAFNDTTAPVIISSPADSTYQVSAGEDIPVEFPEAEDACGTVNITYVDVCSAQGVGGYTATRTFTVVDDCGNETIVTQAVTVNFNLGCDDPAATNYDAQAAAGDGSCIYAGCTNPEALNFNPLADEDDGSCVVATIPGCTDSTACNYFEVANLEDGSCDYCSCLNAPVIEGYSVELETVAVDGVPGMTTYQLYVTMVNPTDVLSSAVGEDGLETYINTSTSFYQDPFGGALGQNTNPLLFGIAPQLPYDSYITIGLTELANTAAGEIEVTAIESDEANWISPFEAGGNIAIDGMFGGAWFTLNGATNGIAGDDLRVLLGQFTTNGTISGQISLQIFPEGDGDNDLILTFPIGNSSCGCTDATACNYVEEATNDDGSCEYTGIYDCDGSTCINDVDGDGICDELEVAGCTDNTALNYMPGSSDDDGSCLFLGCMDPEADNYSSSANVEGECSYPMEGCTDAGAVNYDASALEDDGSCLFLGCMDPEADNYDANANVSGFCSYPVEGCTDAAAANYSDTAVTDDGSCLYPGCTDPTALNYDPSANFDSGCILPLEGCTDSQAENYNPLANTNDGSCEYTPPCPGDLNGDGSININDLLDFFQIYGSDCAE